MPADRSYDAVVIGGGPGGSTAAALLARRGLRVALLERERFPRAHVGESLLPASMPVLEELGVLRQVEAAGFPKKWGATMLWGRDADPWSWHFRETNRTYPHAYQVWRPTFDKILLDNARAKGAHVREGYTVTGVVARSSTRTYEVGSGRVNSVRYRADDGSTGTIEAEWIIDASGQSAILSRTLGLRRWDERFRNMAVYGYFTESERLPASVARSSPRTYDEGNIFIESYSDGWAWNIPLWRGLTSVGVVVDSEQGAAGISKYGVEGYFHRQLDSTRLTRKMLSNARFTDTPKVVKDWSYTSSQTVGDGWILVGDAACFVDPLFSSGVHLAMMSAVMAAAYVAAGRGDPSIRGPAARVYQELYHTEYSHFRELAALFYASNRSVESYFWESRRILGVADDEDARKSFIRAVAGQSARGYERAVLERGDLPEEFRSSVRALESERRHKAATFGDGQLLGLSMDIVPRLIGDVSVERRPIFADGEFQWSPVLVGSQRPEGLAISPLVAALIAAIDGRRSVGEIVEKLTAGASQTAERDLAGQAILSALRLLVVDGLIAF